MPTSQQPRQSHVDQGVDTGTSEVLEHLLATRWSCRAYLPDRVERAAIERVLDIARRTPSWCNVQPWHVDVVSGSATDRLRAALREEVAQGPFENSDIAFPEAYEGVYKERRRASGWQLYESVGIQKGDRSASGRQMLRNFDFFDAPHVAVVTTERALGTYGAVDCGLFVSNFVLAAHSLGIASIPQAALAAQSPVLRNFFGLPDERQVLVGISFGYPDLDHPINDYRTDRQGVDKVATFHN